MDNIEKKDGVNNEFGSLFENETVNGVKDEPKADVEETNFLENGDKAEFETEKIAAEEKVSEVVEENRVETEQTDAFGEKTKSVEENKFYDGKVEGGSVTETAEAIEEKPLDDVVINEKKEQNRKPVKMQKYFGYERFGFIKNALAAAVVAVFFVTVMFLLGCSEVYGKTLTVVNCISGVVSVTNLTASTWTKYVSIFAASCCYIVFVVLMIKNCVTVTLEFFRIKSLKIEEEKDARVALSRCGRVLSESLGVYFYAVLFIYLTELTKPYELRASARSVLIIGGALVLFLLFLYCYVKKGSLKKAAVEFLTVYLPSYVVCALIFVNTYRSAYVYAALNALSSLFGGYTSLSGLIGILNGLWVYIGQYVVYTVIVVYFALTLYNLCAVVSSDVKKNFKNLMISAIVLFAGYLVFEVFIFAGENASIAISDVINVTTRNNYIPLILYSLAGLLVPCEK